MGDLFALWDLSIASLSDLLIWNCMLPWSCPGNKELIAADMKILTEL